MSVKSTLEKLFAIRRYVNHYVLERESETESALMALLAGESCLFIGDAGAAKTQHVHMIAELTGLTLFDTLLSESTKPDFIFGPIDVPALAKGVQRNKIAGYAPDAQILFFDEVFKASGVVLNPLLWLLNEHKFRNGDDGIVQCPTMAIFAASNEIPTDEATRPIYDRFIIRHHVDYIKSSENMGKLFDVAVNKDRTFAEPERMTFDEISFLRRAASRVTVPREIWELAQKIRNQVQNATNVVISDRRLVKAFGVVKANALLHGQATVEKEHLSILANMFWDTVPQIRKTRNIVLANTNAKQGDLFSYVETIESIYDKAIKTGEIREGLVKAMTIFRITKKFTTQAGMEVHRSVTDMTKKLKVIFEMRGEFILTSLQDEAGLIWYKLSEVTSQAWAPAQLRIAGFHFRRTLGYWYVKPTKKMNDEVVIKMVEKALDVTPRIQKLGDH